MPLFLLVFIGAPLIELYILIQVGHVIGALPTIGLCILTAVIGTALLRREGLKTLMSARYHLDRGEVPALQMFEGVALALGGILLLTPGLVTDVIGFACLLPPTRRLLVRAALKRLNVRFSPAPRGHGGEGSHYTIEGTFERRRDHRD